MTYSQVPHTKNRHNPDMFFAFFSHNSVGFVSEKKQVKNYVFGRF